MKCIMPNCEREYQPEIEDDDPDKCDECRKRSAEVAFKVDIEMGKRRSAMPVETSRIRQLFTEEQIRDGDLGKGDAPRINARDLGLF